MALFYTHWSKEEIRDCGLARENPAEPAQSLHEEERKQDWFGQGVVSATEKRLSVHFLRLVRFLESGI